MASLKSRYIITQAKKEGTSRQERGNVPLVFHWCSVPLRRSFAKPVFFVVGGVVVYGWSERKRVRCGLLLFSQLQTILYPANPHWLLCESLQDGECKLATTGSVRLRGWSDGEGISAGYLLQAKQAPPDSWAPKRFLYRYDAKLILMRCIGIGADSHMPAGEKNTKYY